MNKLRIIVIIGAMLAAPTLLFAETIDDSTTCATIRTELDADTPDSLQTREIFEYIDRQLATIDQIYASHGGTEIIGPMSAQKREDTAATVTARCGDHPEETVQESVNAVYEGLKASNSTVDKGPAP